MLVINVTGQVDFEIPHRLSTEQEGLNLDTLSTHIPAKIARVQDDTVPTYAWHGS